MGYSQIEEYLHDFIDILRLLIDNIGSCITEMTTIADELDTFHRGATIASVTASSFGIAGGITTIVGLALAPVTLGASLIVSGVGIGVSIAGGVTGASASIADTINIKKKSQRVKELVDQINVMMENLKELSENINLKFVNPQRWSDRDEFFDIARAAGRGAQLAIRGFRVAAATSGVLAALFIIVDAAFIIKGAVDLHKGSKTEEAARIRECAAELQLIYQDADNLFQDLNVFYNIK